MGGRRRPRTRLSLPQERRGRRKEEPPRRVPHRQRGRRGRPSRRDVRLLSVRARWGFAHREEVQGLAESSQTTDSKYDRVVELTYSEEAQGLNESVLKTDS